MANLRMLSPTHSRVFFLLTSLSLVTAQTFQRLGACPTLGCVFPPDQTDFLSGQLFDIRLEVHAPVNGSEASNKGVADEKFTFCISHEKGDCVDVQKFFKLKDAAVLEKWSFSYVFLSHRQEQRYLIVLSRYYEDLFAKDAGTPVLVNVASKAYRAVSLP